MNSKLKLIGLGLAVATLSACAGMSSDECMATDWSAVGFEDGSRGYTSGQFAKHRKACAKHGVTADFQSYQSGRDRGLQEYCQPGRGFDVGVSGGRYQGVCPINQEDDFLEAYNTGYRLYSLRSDVNRANSLINSKNYELDRIEDRIIANGVEMIAKETTQEQRIYLLAELKDLSERTGQLEAEIEELYDVRARSQAELENYQVMVADLGY